MIAKINVNLAERKLTDDFSPISSAGCRMVWILSIEYKGLTAGPAPKMIASSAVYGRNCRAGVVVS